MKWAQAKGANEKLTRNKMHVDLSFVDPGFFVRRIVSVMRDFVKRVD